MKIVVVVLLLLFPGALLWEPDAGIVPSLTKVAGVTVTTTSNQGSAQSIIDNSDSTHWTSSHCLPSGYFNRADVNILFGACENGFCRASAVPRNDINGATDGTPYKTGHFSPVADVSGRKRAFFSVNVTAPTGLKVLTVDGIFKGIAEIFVVKVDGLSELVATLNQTDSYNSRQIFDINHSLIRIKIYSNYDMGIREIAAIGPNGCKEKVTVDLGILRKVGRIRTRHWAGSNSAKTLELRTSIDGLQWNSVKFLVPTALQPVTTTTTLVSIRFIQLVYHLELKNWNKVYCWEIDAWDENGKWGPKILPSPQQYTLRSILGVNGIWGWGHSKYSNYLKHGEGPWLYNAVASHARNYHNLGWDVTDPDNDPQYERMANDQGTQAKSWLNWDQEYSAWKNASMTIDASIQFLNKTFSQSVWDNAEQSAFNYGQAFARHFGPSGNNLVAAMEVGNEPWDYDANFYATVLKGMSSGARSGDPQLKVLPGAFQAHDKHNRGNYIGTHVLPEVASNIDAINFHTYSYYYTDQGIRTGIFPEHSDSSFNSLRNIIRWRDTNMPGIPVWVTEWGWDASGEDEDCVVPECVDEIAQAVYGIRGLLILVRHNVEKATWFFYANSNTCNTLYCRSGLTTSRNHNFAKKRVFLEFQNLLTLIGDQYFLGVIREDSSAYIYMFGDSINKSKSSENVDSQMLQCSYIIAWRPDHASDKNITTVQVQLPPGRTVQSLHRFDGSQQGMLQTTLSGHFGLQHGVLTLHLTSRPLLVGIGRVSTGTIVG